MPSYAELEYWEERFQTENAYEWLLDTAQLQKGVFPYLRLPVDGAAAEEFVVLNAGCGTSRLSIELSALYPVHTINVDFSPTVIDKWHQEMAGKSIANVEFRVDDLLELSTISDRTIDLVIDKSSFDALACSGSRDVLNQYIKQLRRVLKPRGQWALISYSDRTDYIDTNLFRLVYRGEAVVREASERPSRPAIAHFVHILEPVE